MYLKYRKLHDDACLKKIFKRYLYDITDDSFNSCDFSRDFHTCLVHQDFANSDFFWLFTPVKIKLL